ncbi:MAG TPA: alpha/beta hydrolase [Puia sp.]|jgi:predicted esterase|nr:alpha/beta hydrolase [Puia sp.]
MKQRYLPLLLFLFLFTNCTKNPDSVSNLHLKVEPVRELSNLANIQYGSNKDTSGKIVSLTMDLYFPAGATSAGNYPLVMMIHGGSYLNGDKTDLTSYCNILADSGFVVASINYRLGWRVGNGECKGDTISLIQAGYRALQDANAAMRFLMTNAKLYGLDTGRVFAGGSSAGSSLALNLAFIHNNDLNLFTPVEFSLLGPINTADNNLTSSFKIKGICNMWGALPDSNLITASSATPTISFHGTDDNVIPYDVGYNESCSNSIRLYGSACIQRRLEFYNTPAISNFVIGGGHDPIVYTPGFLMSNTSCFFHRLIKGTPISSKIYTTLESSCD